MTIPRATIRLQFNRDFTFDHAAAIVPYLAKLGISHIYASPLLASQSGSTHGYDVIDPTRINPQLGGRPALMRLVAALRSEAMGIILDIVPNHMAVSSENPWWWDVLKFGRSSRYADFFDIDWQDPDPDLRGKVFLPVLGDKLSSCLDRGEVRLDLAEGGAPIVRYFDQSFPVDPRTMTALSLGDLRGILDAQNYRLADWHDAARQINWRRFFDINQLIALRMDREEVFDIYHRLTLDLLREGVIDGVRVDHVDGLADPAAYCRRLRTAMNRVQPGAYFLVEKILDSEESLCREWSADGTTGYDFMDQVSAVLHDPDGEIPLTELWQVASGDPRPFGILAADTRLEILDRSFPKQRDSLVAILRTIDPVLERSGVATLSAAVRELLASVQRYRLYGDESGISGEELEILEAARTTALSRLNTPEKRVLARLCSTLSTPGARVARQRFGQLSATLTAKAVEDTAFYRYGRLLSRNEVGADPGRLAISSKEFHEHSIRRYRDFSTAMLATATHDHKRGEDQRARLAVLSEISAEWAAFVTHWGGRFAIPQRSVQLTIYQSVVGAWPLELQVEDDTGLKRFRDRLTQWLVKALRETKNETSWDDPDESFELSCVNFLADLFAGKEGFLCAARAFAERIAPAGALNGLTQTTLRLTVPGVPDLYQGTEFWDFSLVDPDNRTAVDFEVRRHALGDDIQRPDVLVHAWRDGRVKQALIAHLLRFRARYPELFMKGTYEPLAIIGPKSIHLLGFVRRLEDTSILVLVSRFAGGFIGTGDTPVFPTSFWQGTQIELPEGLRTGRMVDLLCGRTRMVQAAMTAEQFLDHLPVAVVQIVE